MLFLVLLGHPICKQSSKAVLAPYVDLHGCERTSQPLIYSHLCMRSLRQHYGGMGHGQRLCLTADQGMHVLHP